MRKTIALRRIPASNKVEQLEFNYLISDDLSEVIKNNKNLIEKNNIFKVVHIHDHDGKTCKYVSSYFTTEDETIKLDVIFNKKNIKRLLKIIKNKKKNKKKELRSIRNKDYKIKNYAEYLNYTISDIYNLIDYGIKYALIPEKMFNSFVWYYHNCEKVKINDIIKNWEKEF